MLNNISWFEYLTSIIISALLYYGLVLFTYYRSDLLQILQTKKARPTSDKKFSANLNFQQAHIADINLKNFHVPTGVSQHAEFFTDEVSAYLEQAAKNEIEKEDVVASLCKIASKYPSLATSEFKEGLNQFIVNQTETYCAMFLGEEDLNKVWGNT